MGRDIKKYATGFDLIEGICANKIAISQKAGRWTRLTPFAHPA